MYSVTKFGITGVTVCSITMLRSMFGVTGITIYL